MSRGKGGDLNGTQLVTDPEQLLRAVRKNEMDAVEVHAANTRSMDKSQRFLNRSRQIRQAVENKAALPKPHYPLTEVSNGDIYDEPSALFAALEQDEGDFIDADGRRWHMALIPVFDPLDPLEQVSA